MSTYLEKLKKKYDEIGYNSLTNKQKLKYNIIEKAYLNEKNIISNYQTQKNEYDIQKKNQLSLLYGDKKQYNKNLDLYLKYNGLSQSNDAKKRYQSSINNSINAQTKELTQNYNTTISKMDEDYNNSLNANMEYYNSRVSNARYLTMLDEDTIAKSNGDTYTLNGKNYKLTALCDDLLLEDPRFISAIRNQGFEDSNDENLPNGFSVTMNNGFLFSKKTYIYKNGKWYETEKE